MIIKFPEGPILVDDKPIASDIRINLAINRQARIKGNALKDNDIVPIDIIVESYSFPKLDGLSTIRIDAFGYEFITGKKFNIKLNFNFIKKKWNLSGIIHDVPVNENMEHIMEILKLIEKFV